MKSKSPRPSVAAASRRPSSTNSGNNNNISTDSTIPSSSSSTSSDTASSHLTVPPSHPPRPSPSRSRAVGTPQWEDLRGTDTKTGIDERGEKKNEEREGE